MNPIGRLLADLDAGLDGAACTGRWGLFDGRGRPTRIPQEDR